MTETYHHGNLHFELIQAGLRMLNRDGIASFSLRKLSQELGVSHTAAYRHFGRKEDLLRAIILESSKQFREALASAVQPGVTGDEALMQLGSGYVHFFIAHPEILALFNLMPAEQNLLASILQGDDTKENDSIGVGVHTDNSGIDTCSEHSAFTIFKNLASVAKEHDLYRSLSENELLLGFWSKVHGMATLLITQKDFIPAEQINETIERVLRIPF